MKAMAETVKNMSVPRLRKLLADLPDNARILPDWFGNPPSDDEPGVTVEGFDIETDADGDKYLSVKVSLFNLNEEDDDED